VSTASKLMDVDAGTALTWCARATAGVAEPASTVLPDALAGAAEADDVIIEAVRQRRPALPATRAGSVRRRMERGRIM